LYFHALCNPESNLESLNQAENPIIPGKEDTKEEEKLKTNLTL
jgi:hypothetical protein